LGPGQAVHGWLAPHKLCPGWMRRLGNSVTYEVASIRERS